MQKKFLWISLIFVSAIFISHLVIAQESKGDTHSSSADIKQIKIDAEKGSARAQYLLGVAYEEGNQVEQNPEEARKWLLKSAEQNLAIAQVFLAWNLLGHDDQEAVKWLRKAADQGQVDAQLILAPMYLEGEIVSKDPVEAVRLFQKAAKFGNGFACQQLGVCYKNGTGVGKDLVEAYKWFLISGGDSLSAIKEISPLMTVQQIEEAKKKADSFVPKKRDCDVLQSRPVR